MSDPSTADRPPRYTRRLTDRILIAFHHACDQGDFEVAEQLLDILEMMLTRGLPDTNSRSGDTRPEGRAQACHRGREAQTSPRDRR